jgi:hypothetical protein
MPPSSQNFLIGFPWSKLKSRPWYISSLSGIPDRWTTVLCSFGFSQHFLLLEQDFFTLSTGKRKHDDMASGYVSGKSIPQQDGAGDEEWSLASSLVATSSHTASTQKRYVPHDLYIFLTL